MSVKILAVFALVVYLISLLGHEACNFVCSPRFSPCVLLIMGNFEGNKNIYRPVV